MQFRRAIFPLIECRCLSPNTILAHISYDCFGAWYLFVFVVHVFGSLFEYIFEVAFCLLRFQ